MSHHDKVEDGDTLVHTWHQDGRTITFSWLGYEEVVADRVYAFAFTRDGQILLVSDGVDGAQYWLPGGGVEAGESAEAALARELWEEAAASVEALEKLGTQRADDPAVGSSYQAFYWCRVTLAETFTPEHEISERRLVAPSVFLNTLFWGRDDPKAKLLLERAVTCDRAYTSLA